MNLDKPLKVLLVDDHVLFVEGMKNFLIHHGIEVVGAAGSGVEALVKYEMTRPQLVLMDIQMKNGDGIEATKLLKKTYPEAMIVMLSACEDEGSLFQAMQAGASGYLVKGMEPEQFLREIVKWSEGEVPLAPSIAKRMLTLFADGHFAGAKADEGSLTERQAEVLGLVAKGYIYKEIAGQLNIKEVTVKYHIKEIMTKLHVTNRSELITYAVQQKMVE